VGSTGKHCTSGFQSTQRCRSEAETLQPKVKYLGHVVGHSSMATNLDKVWAVEDWVTPQDLTGLRAFLGLVVYYRQYIPDFAGIAQS